MEKKKKIIIGVAVLVIIIAIIIVVAVVKSNSSDSNQKEDLNSASSAKSAVKDFISAINTQKTSEILDVIDYKGFYVYKEISNEEEDNFVEDYKECDSSEASEYESGLEDYFDSFFETLSSYDDYSFEFEVSEITDTEKLDTGFYKITATINGKIYEDGESDESDSTGVFYTYKGKIIYDDSVLSSAYSYMMWYY